MCSGNLRCLPLFFNQLVILDRIDRWDFHLGIVGLPNVGKSTIFNALTNAAAEASNYQFCTIEPNVGIVPVPDPRLQQLADIADSKKTNPYNN